MPKVVETMANGRRNKFAQVTHRGKMTRTESQNSSSDENETPRTAAATSRTSLTCDRVLKVGLSGCRISDIRENKANGDTLTAAGDSTTGFTEPCC